MTASNVEGLVCLLNEKGGSAYFGEPVSVLDHSLQAAHSAAPLDDLAYTCVYAKST